MSDEDNSIDQPNNTGGDDQEYEVDADGSLITLQLDNTNGLMAMFLVGYAMALLTFLAVRLFGQKKG